MKVHLHDSGADQGADRASRYGARFASQVAAAATAYRRQFRVLGIADAVVHDVVLGSWDALQAWAPDLAAELDHLADGADVPLEDVVALTARTEVLAAAKPVDECSTVVHLPEDGEPVAFQTWDWHSHLAPEATMWSYRTDAGRRVATFTEPGMPAKIGLNDAGLSLNFNILHHRSDGGTDGPGVPVHAVARRILDEARDVDEAAEIARSAPVSASSVFTVATGGHVAAIEVSPVGVGIVGLGADGWLVHTNHFLDPELASGGLVTPDSTTAARLGHLTRAISGPVATGSLVEMAGQLGGDAEAPSPICLRPDEGMASYARWQTLLTVRLAPASGVFEWWTGEPAAVDTVDTIKF